MDNPLIPAVKYATLVVTGDGVTTEWEFNFAGGYLAPEHVKAFTEDLTTGELVIRPLTLTQPNTAKIVPAVADGLRLFIYRDTPKTEPLVDYSSGSILNESSLDKSNKQAVFIAAELADRVIADYDFSNALLFAVSTATEAKTIAQGTDAKATLALETSESAVDTANSAVTTADGAVITAESAVAIAEGAEAEVEAIVNDAIRGIGIYTERYGRVTMSSLPRLAAKLANYAYDNSPITVCTGGSSVGRGAVVGLANAPGEFFVAELRRLLDPAGVRVWNHINLCVDGSSASELNGVIDNMILAGIQPDLFITFYGMNDQAPALFNSGQTLPGMIQGLLWAGARLKAMGSDMIIVDSPHAAVVNHRETVFSFPATIDQNWPTFSAKPVAPESLVPKYSESSLDLPEGTTTITVSKRALRVNAAMAWVAGKLGVPFISAQRGWFRELARLRLLLGSMSAAEFALYGPTETVHPNLNGHIASYRVEITAFVSSISNYTDSPGWPQDIYGDLRMNDRSPVFPAPAVLDIQDSWPNNRGTVRLRHRHGNIMADNTRELKTDVSFDPDTGDMLLHNGAWRHRTTRPFNGDGPGDINGWNITEIRGYGHHHRLYTAGDINNMIATPFESEPVPINSCGTLMVRMQNTGIGTSPQMAWYRWTSNGTAITLALDGAQIGSLTGVVSASGLKVRVTSVADNTNIQLTWTAIGP